MKIPTQSLIYTAGTLLLGATALQAQLTITNGDFSAQNGGGGYSLDVADWFDSTTGGGNFADYVFNDVSVGGDTALMFEDAGNYVYQSLGTVTVGDIAAGGLEISGTAIKRDGRLFTDVILELFSGTPASSGDTIPLTGLSSLGTYTIDGDGAFDGIPAFNGEATEASFTSSTFNIAGLTAGTEVWIHLSSPNAADANFNPGIDDLTIAVIPEPRTFALLGGLVSFAIVMVRRRK